MEIVGGMVIGVGVSSGWFCSNDSISNEQRATLGLTDGSLGKSSTSTNTEHPCTNKRRAACDSELSRYGTHLDIFPDAKF